MKTSAKVRVPASTSNLGSGFDVLGLALKLYNDLELEMLRGGSGKCEVEIEGEGKNSLPKDSRNFIWQAALQTFRKVNFPVFKFSFRLRAINRIPLARGLGSSAAAALSGILAANALSGNKLSQSEILSVATELEGHPDNAAPQIFGGLCVSSAGVGGKINVVRLNPPRASAVVCVPDFALSTVKAREALPERVSLKDAVFNISRTALFLAAVFSGKPGLLGEAMKDQLHQPYRKKLVRGFDRVIAQASQAGAYGAALSGAGPSMFALSSAGKAQAVARAMEKGFLQARVQSRSKVLAFDMKGAVVSVR